MSCIEYKVTTPKEDTYPQEIILQLENLTNKLEYHIHSANCKLVKSQLVSLIEIVSNIPKFSIPNPIFLPKLFMLCSSIIISCSNLTIPLDHRDNLIYTSLSVISYLSSLCDEGFAQNLIQDQCFPVILQYTNEINDPDLLEHCLTLLNNIVSDSFDASNVILNFLRPERIKEIIFGDDFQQASISAAALLSSLSIMHLNDDQLLPIASVLLNCLQFYFFEKTGYCLYRDVLFELSNGISKLINDSPLILQFLLENNFMIFLNDNSPDFLLFEVLSFIIRCIQQSIPVNIDKDMIFHYLRTFYSKLQNETYSSDDNPDLIQRLFVLTTDLLYIFIREYPELFCEKIENEDLNLLEEILINSNSEVKISMLLAFAYIIQNITDSLKLSLLEICPKALEIMSESFEEDSEEDEFNNALFIALMFLCSAEKNANKSSFFQFSSEYGFISKVRSLEPKSRSHYSDLMKILLKQ